MYALSRPPPNLLPLQRLLWPLIYAQLVALKAWVRAVYGPGISYLTHISGLGRVSLLWLPAEGVRRSVAIPALPPGPAISAATRRLAARLAAASGFDPDCLPAVGAQSIAPAWAGMPSAHAPVVFTNTS